MIRKILNYTIKNKNFVMFITSMIYIMGLIAYFTKSAILISILFSILAIISIYKNLISPKLVLFWILIFYIGFLNCNFRLKNTDELYTIAPKKIVLEGQIVSIPNSNVQNKSKFFFKTNKGNTLVTVQSDSENFSNLKIGNFYKISGKLRTPFEAVNPSQFDYGQYLKNYNTFTVFYCNLNDIQLIEKNLSLKWKFQQRLDDTRTRILNTHQKYLKSPNTEVLGGIVFGDDAIAPPQEIKSSFIHSGLLHILAASGMNVAFIYGFWYIILFNLFKIPQKITILSGMAIIILYSLMTGLGASVIRATIMLLFILIGKLIDRDTHSIALLSLVAMLMLIYNPLYINNVSFQLSFLVTFGILISGPIIFEKLKKLPNWLSGLVFIPIIAQIWVAPIQMYYFNTFSLYSVFANILITPILSFISFGGFISSIFATIKSIADFVCKVFDFILNPLITLLLNISNYFAQLPSSLITTTHPNQFQIILYYLIVLTLTLLIKNFNKKLFAVIIPLTIILIISTINLPNKNLEIITFSLGDADSCLIKTPENKYILIDTAKSGYAGGKSQAEVIVLKYLKDNGIKTLEAMILTHFDNDHSGGAVDLYNNLKIKKTYINSFNDTSYTSKKIYANIKNLTIPKNNSIIYEEKDLILKVFHANFKNDNESSIITLVKYKNFTELLMGDAGIIAYNTLKNYMPKNINVLKVGHHGAKNVINKEMLTNLSPDFAVISAGKNNSNHPHLLTLNELRKTQTLRTDKHNSIKIISSGNAPRVYYFNKNEKKYLPIKK